MNLYTPDQVEFVQERAAERIGEILDALGVDYIERRDYLQGPCPVHEGDNQRAWFWAFRTQHWECRTRSWTATRRAGGVSKPSSKTCCREGSGA